nr:DUF6382 domain-containing protein [uncultured Mediterraneibacter sp.]
MKVTYENGWEYMDIHIDLPLPYEDNYQLRMLELNEIDGLIRVKGSGRDGHSRYTYRVKNGISIEKKYSVQEMKQKDVEALIKSLLRTVEDISGHLLNPDGLILSPDLIYTHNGRYYFCYLPVQGEDYRCSLCSAFHQLTEYFVKRLDYHDTGGIFLVYKLHKETMKESYELRNIIEECRQEEKADQMRKNPPQRYQQKEKQTEKLSYDEEKEFFPESAVFKVIEQERERSGQTGKRPGFVKKALSRLKSGKWGEWQDLITEIDRH